ncbi:MAG TPA: nucleotidyltransferase family protein [Thermoanaerobaculia bacterium]|jgi:molybdenum cofactor cytidylyltransferase|nr:nucleotidyltransferase family protein [Thermoanaerobaculia bacterium]
MIVAVILAAGASTRLGSPKQDIVFEGETLLQRAERLARAVAEDVIVVTPELNPDAEEGIASSIRAGVRRAGNARILIMLCDQPLITVTHLQDLIAIDAPIVATGYAGIAGVPAVFAPEFASELLALRGDRGARAVIEAHRDVTRVVSFEDAAVDIDTTDDLRKLKG